jgi:hypothetical protein
LLLFEEDDAMPPPQPAATASPVAMTNELGRRSIWSSTVSFCRAEVLTA